VIQDKILLTAAVSMAFVLIGRIIFDWLKNKKNGSVPVICSMTEKLQQHINDFNQDRKLYDDAARTIFEHDKESEIRGSKQLFVLEAILAQLKENGNKLDNLK